MKKFIALLVFILIVSCDQNYNSDNFGDTHTDVNFLTEAVEVEETRKSAFSKPKLARNNIKDAESTLERKLIKNGRVSFETDSLQKTKATLLQLIKKHKGYISSDNTSKNSFKIYQNLIVRLPNHEFDKFLAEMSKGVESFDEKTITVSDVTERFYDLKTRLKTKKELEKRYLQILSKAKTVKDILQVEKQLGVVREEIESAEGKLKYLSNQVSFSTLRINFYQKTEISVEKENKIVRAFYKGVDAIQSFFLFIISVWPFVILVIVGFFVVRRKIKK